MQLSKILKNVELVEPISADVEIKNIEFDSRKVGVGSMFVATRGTAVDGHDFIAKAIEAGAVAVRSRKNGDMGAMPADEFVNKLILEVANRER